MTPAARDPLAYLSRPGFERPLELLRGRYIRNGGARGRVQMPALTEAEAHDLSGLLTGRLRPLPQRPFWLDLRRVEAALVAGFGLDLRAALELTGGPLTTRAERLASEATQRAGRLDETLAHPLCARDGAVRGWVERLFDTGQAARYDDRVLHAALDLGLRLPVQPGVERARLAAELLEGDPHALDGSRPLARLVLGQLAARAGEPPPSATAERRALWQRFGVLTDPASSDVLVLGLRPLGDGTLARAVRLLEGTHLRLTLGQLDREPLCFEEGLAVFVCENPTVLLAAERALGRAAPAMVCTDGWPSGAALTLLGALRDQRARLRYHGDFDWDGVRIARSAAIRLGAEPWRYDAMAYRRAVETRSSQPLTGRPLKLGDDLTAAMASAGREIHEEAVLDDLLGDLAEAAG